MKKANSSIWQARFSKRENLIMPDDRSKHASYAAINRHGFTVSDFDAWTLSRIQFVGRVVDHRSQEAALLDVVQRASLTEPTGDSHARADDTTP